jgi:hypothetical protein
MDLLLFLYVYILNMSKKSIDFNTLNNLFPTDDEYDNVKAVLIDFSKITDMTKAERDKYFIAHQSIPSYLDSNEKMKRFIEKFRKMTA